MQERFEELLKKITLQKYQVDLLNISILKLSSEAFDYERLAEEWIVILQPIFEHKREEVRRKKKILNLSNIKSEHKNIEIEPTQLWDMAERCILGEDIDKRIAACIIGISSN